MIVPVYIVTAYVTFIGFVILVNSIRKDAKEYRRVLKYMEEENDS